MALRGWVVFGAAVACLGVAGAIAGKQSSLYKRLPLQSHLVEAVQREMGSRKEEPGGAYCIRLPVDGTPPDSRSKLRRYGWHADFYRTPAGSPQRTSQLTQLDALVGVGLLRRESVSIAGKDGEAARDAWRYRMTPAGWKEFDDRNSCFTLGRPVYLGFLDSRRVEQNGQTAYEVTVRAGLAGADQLAAWAKDAAVVQAFPALAKALEQRTESFRLQWRDGRWQRYQDASVVPPGLEAAAPEERRRIEALARMPEATRQELETLIAKFPHQSCLVLPGSEKLPADRDLFDGKRYRFAIYANKPRTHYDRVVIKTVPVVNRLLAVGLVVRVGSQPIAGEGVDRGQTFEADVYELAPHLQQLMVRNCVSLGPMTQEFVDIRYRSTDEQGMPFPSYTYKKIVRLKDPPPAVADALMLAAWPDLRGILEDGHACSGEFHFNKESRDAEGGVGTCWYAFDSLYENY